MRWHGWYARSGKRRLDLLLAVASLPIAAPLLCLGWLLARLSTRESGFFTQERVGMNGERFLIWKLCTMRPTTDGAGTEPHFGVTAGVSALVTPIGRWLRRTKLDEVPQLRNVFAGEMSIVGPRPDVPDWIDLLNTHPTALTVRPGLTSLASLIYADEEFILGQEDDPVAAYATVVLPHKLVLNDLYANNVSFALDMAILGLSAASVLWPSGAKRGAHALCSRLEHRLPADSSA